MESIQQRLKRIRTERELGVKEFASRIGVPESTYREWEYGRTLSGPPYVKIAEVLEVPVSYLLTGQTSEISWLLQELGHLESQISEMKSRVSSRS